MLKISKNYWAELLQLAVIVCFLCLAQSSFAQTDITSTPELIDNGQLLLEIDEQLLKLNAAKRNGDAFSLALAENYLQYGALLTEAGAYDEANSAFEQALQIQRSNHGIDAPEQMPTLEALFNNHMALQAIESAETYVARALRIEKENSNIVDRPSVNMQLRLGHYYLNRLETSSLDGEKSVSYLRSAIDYFMAIIEQNKHRRLDQVSMPYGELAMVSYYGSNISRKPEIIYEEEEFDPGSVDPIAVARGIISESSQRITRDAPAEDIAYNDYLNRVVPNALEELKVYFRKAYDEENVEQALQASLALGDLNYLAGRDEKADEYYKVAWSVSEVLPDQHPSRMALRKPTEIPSFSYAYSAVEKVETKSDVTVNFAFDVDEKGRLRNISTQDNVDSQLSSKARRELRDIIFRPALVDGNRTSAENFVYPVLVKTD